MSFKPAIVNRFKELKETTSKVIKRSMMTVTPQIENINKEVDHIKNNHIEVLVLRSTITENLKSLEGYDSIFDLVGGRNSELEVRTIGVIQSKE